MLTTFLLRIVNAQELLRTIWYLKTCAAYKHLVQIDRISSKENFELLKQWYLFIVYLNLAWYFIF